MPAGHKFKEHRLYRSVQLYIVIFFIGHFPHINSLLRHKMIIAFLVPQTEISRDGQCEIVRSRTLRGILRHISYSKMCAVM